MVRPLSPSSRVVADQLLDQRYGADQTVDVVNRARTGRTPGPENAALYEADDIRALRNSRASSSAPQGLPQRDSSLARPGPSDPLLLKIRELRLQRASLANFDGSIDDQIAKLEQQRRANAPSRRGPAPALAQLPTAALTRELIARHNPQDSGLASTPLPSGASVHSQVLSSVGAPSFSAASGTYPPISHASSSTVPAAAASSTSRKGKGKARMPPYPTSSPSAAGPSSAQQSGPQAQLPDPGPRVKTPNGHHLLPAVRRQIQEFYEQDPRIMPAEVARRIPGLNNNQASDVLRAMRNPGHSNKTKTKQAQKLTGRSTAKAHDYELLKRTRLALDRMGPTATAADYMRDQREALARKKLGNADATVVDYGRYRRATRAREMTGDLDSNFADYNRMVKSQQIVGERLGLGPRTRHEIREANRAQPAATAATQPQSSAMLPAGPVRNWHDVRARTWRRGDQFTMTIDHQPATYKVLLDHTGGDYLQMEGFQLIQQGG